MTQDVRQALFISHATPEDNVFARWLGAKLSASGYEVWADVMHLQGGLDWQRELEHALRHRAIKVLVACSPVGFDKQGVRNEVEIACNVALDLNDPKFIIPLKLAPYEPPFRIAHVQHIDFTQGWAAGLAELLETLQDVHKIPHRGSQPNNLWHTIQAQGGATVSKTPEPLISNWLQIGKLPDHVYYLEPPFGLPLEKFNDRSNHQWPVVPVLNGLLSFARTDQDGLIARDLPAKIVAKLLTAQFLEDGWPKLNLAAFEAQRTLSDLGNQAIERYFHRKQLSFMEMARSRAWWGNIKAVPKGQIRFTWPDWTGRRQIIGQSGKRAVHWHYGVSAQCRTDPFPHFRLSGRLIFSENGLDAITDAKRAHRLRRSFAKGWRNARWRDMLLAFLRWTFDGKAEVLLPVADEQNIVLALPPIALISPISAVPAGEEPPDEDDPDADFDIGEDDAAEDSSGDGL